MKYLKVFDKWVTESKIKPTSMLKKLLGHTNIAKKDVLVKDVKDVPTKGLVSRKTFYEYISHQFDNKFSQEPIIPSTLLNIAFGLGKYGFYLQGSINLYTLDDCKEVVLLNKENNAKIIFHQDKQIFSVPNQYEKLAKGIIRKVVTNNLSMGFEAPNDVTQVDDAYIEKYKPVRSWLVVIFETLQYHITYWSDFLNVFKAV